ncbi:MAG: hypothetical protein ABFC38_05260 [Methanospirillum sp.]
MELLPLLRSSLLRFCGVLVCLALLACGVSAVSTDVHVVKLAADGSTVLAERTVDYRWLEANLPVRGDGSTHYYHQGPTFDDADLWDPTESKNVQDKDMGAVKGTALRDLCSLVGGMQSGDALVVRASDGFSKRFSHGSVYSPSARQGQMVLTWYKAGEGYVPSYSTGMRIVFYADTSTNPWGWHVFGNADMKASMPSSEWHYFNGVYPTTTGLSVQSVNELRVLSTQSAEPTTTATTRPATTATKTPVPTTLAPGSATTKATTPPGTSGATVVRTTAQGATTVPTASAVTAATLLPVGTTTMPADDGGSVVVTTTGAATETVSPLPILTTVATVTSNPTVNGTGNATPSPTGSPVPTATGYDRTYDYSVSTGLDYVSDLDVVETATVTATPTPTATANATEFPTASVAATSTVTAAPPPSALALSPAPTASPNGWAATRSLSFTFSFQVRESGNGPAINTSPGGSAAIVSSTSPLGAFWAFLKAVASLIDPFFT